MVPRGVPLCLRVVIAGALGLAGRHVEGSEDPLLDGLSSDPHADQDVYLSLTPEQLDIFGDDQPELGVDELLEKTEAFQLSTHVTVKLIGFDSRRRDCHSANVPSPFSRRFNRDKNGVVTE